MLSEKINLPIEATRWANEMNVQVTVCDLNATIVYMNKASIANFEKRGGAKLIGQSLFSCHNEKSNQRIREMLAKPQSQTVILDKTNYRKIIHQIPWIENDEHKGIIELGFKEEKID